MNHPASIKPPFSGAVYQTARRRVSLFSRAFPELSFYSRFLLITVKAGAKAGRGRYDGRAWCRSSLGVLRALEGVGIHFDVSGIQHLASLETPCVVIANHMSVLETTVLPIIIQPIRPVTFIVKDSLLAYPVFKHVLSARDPIVVGRTHPRRDLKIVLEGGTRRLRQGISIIVFPQTTRTRDFDPARFNTIGIKLAQRAQVPVLPLALATDAWGNGRRLKDFGKIDPSKMARFAFGEPIWVQERSAEAHRAVKDFIAARLTAWGYASPPAVPPAGLDGAAH